MKSFELWMCQWQSFAETDLMDVVGWPAVVLGIITSTNDGCGDIAAMIHHKFNQARTSLSCCLITKSRKRQQKSPIADKWTPTKKLFSEDCVDKLWFSENIWWHITWWSLFQTISWFLRAPSHCPNQSSLIVKDVNWHSLRKWQPYLTTTSYWLNQCSLIIIKVTWHTNTGNITRTAWDKINHIYENMHI